MHETDAAPPPPPSAPPLPPLWRRLTQLFYEPGKVGDALVATPAWFGAFTVGALLVGLGAILVPGEIWAEWMRSQMASSGQPAPEGVGEMSGTIFRIGGAIGGPVFWFVWTLAFAGIATLVFAFILGDDGSYKKYLSLVAHALVIAALGTVLTVPLKIAQGNPQLTLSVGTFFGELGDGWLGRFLPALDLFGLWSTVVLGIMVSRVDPRRSAGSAVTILIVMTVGLAALISLIPFGR
jgi:hypothetical protein